jgi:hypothetical protein
LLADLINKLMDDSKDLAKVLMHKPKVVALNLGANVAKDRAECRLVFTHKVGDGVTRLTHYGSLGAYVFG